jgi:two-component SAPR family response regulator
MKAILVDDEYYALQGLKMELESIDGIEVADIFDSGAAMLDRVAEIRPDIIFLDIEMPVMNGLEVFKRLMEMGTTANIVFVTAYNHYAVQAFELHAMDYVVKPAVRERLLKTIERVSYSNRHRAGSRLLIKCFGHFSLLLDGEEINRSWRTAKAEELLAYLICRQGEFVSKEKVAEALWPEYDSDKSSSNLYLAYYHAKKKTEKLGIKLPIDSVRGKMRLIDEAVNCDFIHYNKLISLLSDKTKKNRINIMEEAVELYTAPPFEDKYYSWLLDYQQVCESRYTDMLYELTEYYANTQQNSKKAEYYNKKLSALIE